MNAKVVLIALLAAAAGAGLTFVLMEFAVACVIPLTRGS